ncbi:unnamed protein product [Moneuplotes crassus]|uniref:RING-type domain-containing protein n=1 Tax=Euplotes crassus TaxID=5936 RepID=A0AAD1X822_EUPCR|nr:unnamed protein product [Moneuplotes crassus]
MSIRALLFALLLITYLSKAEEIQNLQKATKNPPPNPTSKTTPIPFPSLPDPISLSSGLNFTLQAPSLPTTLQPTSKPQCFNFTLTSPQISCTCACSPASPHSSAHKGEEEDGLGQIEERLEAEFERYGYSVVVECGKDEQEGGRRSLKSPTGGEKSGNGMMKSLKIFLIGVVVVAVLFLILVLYYVVIKVINKKKKCYGAKWYKKYLRKYTTEIQREDRESRYDQTECVICLDSFVADRKICMINACGHIFHSECLEEYFKIKQRLGDFICPLCKTSIRVQIVTKEDDSVNTN